MSTISSLVFNALVSKKGVNLPEVGSLLVVTQPARIRSRSKLSSPRSHVMFSRAELNSLPSLVGLIAQRENVDEAAAREMYEQWLVGARVDKSIVIDNVGEIRRGVFTPAPPLEEILNPDKQEIIDIKPRVRPLHILGIGAAMLVLIGVVAFFYMERTGYLERMKLAVEETVSRAQIEERIAAQREKEKADSVARAEQMRALAADLLAEVTPDSLLFEQLLAADVIDPAEKERVQEKIAEVTSPKPTQSPTQKPAEAVPAQATQQKPAAAQSPASGLGKPVAGKFYVIAGVYSTEANADKFIAGAAKKLPSARFTKLLNPKGKIMVSVMTADNQAAADAILSDFKVLDGSVWVLEAK